MFLRTVLVFCSFFIFADLAMSLQQECSDNLPLNKIRVLGSHNSYHQEPLIPLVDAWRYSHPPLDEQFKRHNLRQIELDLQWTGENFRVYHVPVVDNQTSCSTLGVCLKKVMKWAKRTPDHELVYIMLEIKNPKEDFERSLKLMEDLEESILKVVPKNKILMPDQVRQGEKNVRAGVQKHGWPTWADARNKIMFLLEANDATVKAYTRNYRSLRKRLIFPFGHQFEAPYAVAFSLNEPETDRDVILAAAASNLLVRTRADSDLKYDKKRAHLALHLPVNIISTDFFRKSDQWVHLADSQVWDCHSK